MKNNKMLTFDLWAPEGTPGALGVHQIKKLNETKSCQSLILVWGLFMKNVKIPKLWSPHQPASSSSPIFPGRGPKIKIPLPTFFFTCFPVSEMVWHNPPAPKPWEEIDLAENPLFGVWAWPWGPWGPNQPPKNYLQGVKWTLKIWPQSGHGVKSYFTL